MDIPAIISEMGGGLPAVIIVGLASAVVILWRRVNELQDKRVEEMRANSSQMHEAITATAEIARSMEAR